MSVEDKLQGFAKRLHEIAEDVRAFGEENPGVPVHVLRQRVLTAEASAVRALSARSREAKQRSRFSGGSDSGGGIL